MSSPTLRKTNSIGLSFHTSHLSSQLCFKKMAYFSSPGAHLDDVETGAVLCSSSNADPNQVLRVLLQGHCPRYSGDAPTKRKE